VSRDHTAFISAAVIASGLVALAYIVAPRSCQGGAEFYVWGGGAALLLLLGLPFFARAGRSTLVRCALALGFLVLGVCAWIAGLLLANVRFICGLGYL